MFPMFNKFFSMLTHLFTAGENLAKALENVSEVTVEMSGEYADEQRSVRATKAALRAKDAAKQLKAA